MKGFTIFANVFLCRIYQGVIFEDDKLKVEALRVQHPPIDDCFALKFETASVKIVFGADTTYFPPLAEFAKMRIFLCMKPCIWVRHKNLRSTARDKT